MTTLRIPRRFNGPPTSANGGVASGLLAATLGTSGAVQVTLRLPPPVELDLAVTGGSLFDGDALIAEARAVPDELVPVPAVDFETAAEASTRYDGFTDHPFPACVVCGTDRTDGLACYAGALDPADLSRVATPFVLRPELVGADLPHDDVLVWAALDCPGGWSIGLVGRRAVLGRMTALVHGVPELGERCVVTGQCDGWEGRKAFSRSSLYGGDGRLLGTAAATWIELR